MFAPNSNITSRLRSFFQSFWPTFGVDMLSNIHLYLLWSFYVFDYDCFCKRRVWSDLLQVWPRIDYMAQVQTSSFNMFLFLFWTMQVVATIFVVRFHTTNPHHPKFYASRLNRIAMVCHILGGSIADFGGWVGFVLGNTTLIKIASGAGLFLHAPSAFWQARNLHGRREVMQPTYYFCNSLLVLKYAEVWFQQGSFASVVAMGYTVNIFALVRVNFATMRRTGMALETIYDLSVLLAGVTNLPIILGLTGCIQFISSLFIWNYVFGRLLPDPEKRRLLQTNRTCEDVFPDTFKGKRVDFLGTFKKFSAMHDDDRHAVAHAAFHIIAGDNNTIELDELEELLESWGLPDAKIVAKQMFSDADVNGDGAIDFSEFEKKLWFIWERLYAVGEAERTEDGHLQRNISRAKRISFDSRPPLLVAASNIDSSFSECNMKGIRTIPMRKVITAKVA